MRVLWHVYTIQLLLLDRSDHEALGV
jgi:hypothetical protein